MNEEVNVLNDDMNYIRWENLTIEQDASLWSKTTIITGGCGRGKDGSSLAPNVFLFYCFFVSEFVTKLHLIGNF